MSTIHSDVRKLIHAVVMVQIPVGRSLIGRRLVVS